jgi:UDP-N-acetylmuramoyl-L-alanyl-D-glutamate--2,6-diaminopimelate ligase
MAAMEQAEGKLLCHLLADVVVDVPAMHVQDITASSDKVVPGALFLACRGGQHHGLEFVAEAVAAGATVVVWEPEDGRESPQLPDTVTGIPVEHLGAQVGSIADRFFAAPSAELQLTGVTGTNGKTTVAWLTSQALSRLGGAVAYMGTLGYGMVPELVPSALTTPGCILVHRRLRELLDQGASGAVLEVSSHGLDQGRVDGVRLDVAAFTNLSRDHLDYHGDLDAYKAAKARLFSVSSLEAAVINVGDSFGAQLAGELDGDIRVITVALTGRSYLQDGPQADLQADFEESAQTGLRLKFSGGFGVAELVSPMWGDFNAENLLVATGLILAHGYTLEQAITALQSVRPPPGRMQLVEGSESAPTVIVDFAHTPDALLQALQTVRTHSSGRVVCVFGCGGNRDEGKRTEMGAIAAQLADHVIVTNDNPRDEDPQQIVAAIVEGITADSSHEVITDRATAIRTAIEQSAADDVVLIAGKGSENFQLTGTSAEAFSDAAVAAEILGATS